MTDILTTLTTLTTMSAADLAAELDDIGFALMLTTTADQRLRLMERARDVMAEQERRGERRVR